MSFLRRTKEQALGEVSSLVEAFGKNLRYYKSDEYLEANVRSEFIDKFLMALNWDVNNENLVAPRYREVISEFGVVSGNRVKRPDYALCIGGTPVLYVEAKPASEKILNAEDSSLQLRRYAYSAKKPLSILTNFGELAVYDTRKSPVEGEPSEKHRVKYLTYEQYVDNFDYLWDVLSYDSVLKGSVETYFDKEDGNYERNDVDDEILKAVDNWRKLLIHAARDRGWRLTEDNINHAVQKLMNRMVGIWREKGF